MTRGTLTLGETSIKFEDVKITQTSIQKVYTGRISGDESYLWTFYGDNGWTFTEDKPSAYENYLKLPVGTQFEFDGIRGIKLDDKNYASRGTTGVWDLYYAVSIQDYEDASLAVIEGS